MEVEGRRTLKTRSPFRIRAESVTTMVSQNSINSLAFKLSGESNGKRGRKAIPPLEKARRSLQEAQETICISHPCLLEYRQTQTRIEYAMRVRNQASEKIAKLEAEIAELQDIEAQPVDELTDSANRLNMVAEFVEKSFDVTEPLKVSTDEVALKAQELYNSQFQA